MQGHQLRYDLVVIMQLRCVMTQCLLSHHCHSLAVLAISAPLVLSCLDDGATQTVVHQEGWAKTSAQQLHLYKDQAIGDKYILVLRHERFYQLPWRNENISQHDSSWGKTFQFVNFSQLLNHSTLYIYVHAWKVVVDNYG